MRFGGPVFVESEDPEVIARAHVEKGYRAAFCPKFLQQSKADQVSAVRRAFEANEVIIAEVGAWCNPLSQDAAESEKNISYVAERLALADDVGARCCVNIVGTWYKKNWYGPCAENFGDDFFAHAVDVSRRIIDMVKPKKAKMTFEIMPFSFLDSPQDYMRFLRAVDRPTAGIHFDPINCINSPRVYFNSTAFFEEAFKLFGNNIVSMHLKDIYLKPEPVSVILEEVPIGTGGIDYVTLLRMIGKLPPDTPALLEHLPNEAAYMEASCAVKRFSQSAGVEL